MTLISPVDSATADPRALATLQGVQARIGMIPNLHATLAHAPAALDALLQINGALGHGALSEAEREVIALATSQANGCHYCVSAHSLLGRNAGLDPAQLAQSRAAKGGQGRAAALALLARQLVEQRGHLSSQDVDRARAEGLGDGDLMEAVAHVAATTFTNYANNLARTEIDFPPVPLALVA